MPLKKYGLANSPHLRLPASGQKPTRCWESNQMPKFLEDKLKSEYGQNSKIPYMVMNKMGAMHGNKETAKGRAMERKHALDSKAASRIRSKAARMMKGKA